jgi:hypothetical protein
MTSALITAAFFFVLFFMIATLSYFTDHID